MSHLTGWINLLLGVGKRFESLSDGQATLHLYICPNPEQSPWSNLPKPIQERCLKQITQSGTLSAGSVYLDISWYQLFANPEPPTDHYLSVLYGYRDRFNKLAEEAWSILPAVIRRRAFGDTGYTGWLVVVLRTLQRAGTGAAQWTPILAQVEGDLAKASALAIRALVEEATAATVPEPRNVGELAEWLAMRAEWLRAFFADTNSTLSLEYVQEINDLFGPPMSGRGNVLQLWAKGMVSLHLQWVLFTAQRWLDARGFTGQPVWKNEPIEDDRWWFRANDHLSALLEFLRRGGEESKRPGSEAIPVTELPAPTDRDACEQVIRALEAWKKWVYPESPGPGPTTLEEFGELTTRLVSWSDRHSQIDIAPLKELLQIEQQRFRVASDPSLPWHPTEAERVAGAYKAVGICDRLIRWLTSKREEFLVPKGEGFDDLLTFARDSLKGIERRVVELVSEKEGECKLSDLAADSGIGWNAPYDDAWNSARKRINKKLKTAGLSWRLGRSDNAARLRHTGRK